MPGPGMDQEKRAISGTWGELWLDGNKVGECYGFSAKYAVNKEDIQMCGVMHVGKKIKNYTGTGSLKLWKTNSRMAALLADNLRNGRDPKFTIVSKLDDKDAYGAERVTVFGVSFDELILADWEAGVVAKTEHPFTFEDFKYLDLIGVQ